MFREIIWNIALGHGDMYGYKDNETKVGMHYCLLQKLNIIIFINMSDEKKKEKVREREREPSFPSPVFFH